MTAEKLLSDGIRSIKDAYTREHTARKNLAKMLENAEAENAKLREQMERLVTLLRNDCDIDASWDGLRKFWSIGLTEDGCLMRDRACKAEAENAKLRELVGYFLRCERYLCDGCPLNEHGLCSILEKAEELGFEVPE